MSAKGVHLVVRKRLTTATGSLAYAGQRVHPNVLPQNPILPSYVYHEISGPREEAMGSSEGTVNARVQLDIYDDSYLGTASGGKHARDALARWSGTATGIVVHDVFVLDERDGFQDQLQDSERVVWRRTLDFRIHYRED